MLMTVRRLTKKETCSVAWKGYPFSGAFSHKIWSRQVAVFLLWFLSKTPPLKQPIPYWKCKKKDWKPPKWLSRVLILVV